MRRRLTYAVAIVAMLAAMSSPVFAGTQNESPSQLRILLTNDDGYDSVGIQLLRDQLRAAGHDVYVVSPWSERSGSGAAVTFTPMRFEALAPKEWRLDATPATCVFAALRLFLEEPPDLIVSGINVGHNIGASAPFSGTVGATIAGIYAHLGGADSPIPAIAFSADYPDSESDSPEISAEFSAHFATVASFAVNFVETLVDGNEVGIPKGMALSVNYPGVPIDEVRGVVTTRQGRNLDFQLGYGFADVDGAKLIVPTLVDVGTAVNEISGADTHPFAAGFITVTPLDGDYGAAEWLGSEVRHDLERLRP